MDTPYERAPDETPAPEPTRGGSRAGRVIATTALAAGMAVGGYGIAHAASDSSSSTTSPSNSQTAPGPGESSTDGSKPDCPGGRRGGPNETPLTGEAATKATAAAKAAVPGGTVLRVETDANDGAKYEAHVRKSDGTFVTVLMDENFKVTSVESFTPRGGPGGPGGPRGGGYGGGYGTSAPQGQPSA